MARGRPAHKPTPETRAQVFALASFGARYDDIAKLLGISDDTLKKHYPDELAKGAVERNAEVAGFLYHSASGRAISDGASYSDCLKAAMFWLKTRAQWRETNHHDLTSSDGSMSPKGIDATKLSDAALQELMNARSSESD